MTNEIDEIAIPLLKRILTEAQSEWLDPKSKYKEYRSLQIDKRGSFGERFFSETLHKIFLRRIKFEYQDGDQGDWDLKINDVKFEIKTSSIDVNKKFQNEGIKQDGDYEGIMFLGVTPNNLYIKFVKKSEIDFSKLHNRGERGTGTGHKWNFKTSDMVKIESLNDIKEEFKRVFGNLPELENLK